MLAFYSEIKQDYYLLFSNPLRGSIQLLKDVDKMFLQTTSDSKSSSYQMEERTQQMDLFEN